MSMTGLLYPSTYVKPDINNVPVWYEFLLKKDLLSKHLTSVDPEPSGCSLIKQFYDQANRPINEQGQILPPSDNERNKSLKTLALQTAALLKWNLETFEKELPIASRHQLLMELMKTCKVSMPVAPQNELGSALEKLHDHSIMAVVLYCCWTARTVVKSTFPCKPGGRVTPTVPQSVPYQANAQQRCDEIRDQILSILKDQTFEVVQYLEAVLIHVKRAIYLPNYNTFASHDSFKLNEDPAGMKVSCEELHAQVCYDLGCMHFAHNFYEKAGEMFGHVGEWLRRKNEDHSGFCSIDEDRLNGYRMACNMVNKRSVGDIGVSVDNDGLFYKVKECLKEKGPALRELGEIIIEDSYKKELSTPFLDEVEREIETDTEGQIGSDTLFDIKWSVAVRRAVRGVDQPTGLWTFDMNVARLQRIIGFVQQISKYVSQDEGGRLGRFLFSLANNLSDRTLREQLLNFEITQQLISKDNLNQLILRLKSDYLRPLVLESESPASPDGSSPMKSNEEIVSDLERTLLTNFDPSLIKETLAQLHNATSGRKFHTLSSRWELNPFYLSFLSSCAKDTMQYDFLHILLAKSQHCCQDRDYSKAKNLIAYIQNSCTGSDDMKLKRLASQEMLKVEVLDLLDDETLQYPTEEECSELRGQLSDVVTRCRHVLSSATEGKKHLNFPLYLLEVCTAMLLNLEDWTFFVTVPRGHTTAPCLKLASMVASVRVGIIDRSMEARKPASELWSATMGMFAAPTSANIPSGGRGQQKKQQIEPLRNLLPQNAIISRPAFLEFVKLIKNPNVLQVVVSLLVQLHRLCRTDILSDICCPHSGALNELWPTGLDGTPISGACVTLALREVLAHCIDLQPDNRRWIRTLADVHYAFNNYGAALRAYLLLGAINSSYFNQISSTGPYDDDQVVQKMVKCCMQMRCFTQAAVLCQLTKDVDYSTAFKALQEHRERTDAAEVHYLEHIWNVQILEHAAYEHRESGESLKKKAAVSAATRPELNACNAPQVGARVKASRKARFFQAMARQYLC